MKKDTNKLHGASSLMKMSEHSDSNMNFAQCKCRKQVKLSLMLTKCLLKKTQVSVYFMHIDFRNVCKDILLWKIRT